MNWQYEKGRIYCQNDKNELLAETTFVFAGADTVDIDRTYVHPALRGQGVAGKMMEAVAEYLRKEGLRATATCSYAKGWLEKHRDTHADIIARAEA